MAIPNQTVSMHHEGDVFEDIVAGFRTEDFPHLLDLFNSPYANVIAAPIREYATNALDSHIAAGNTAPVEITLPTADSLEFVVQDYGLGMDIEDLRNTYANYGASSKRDSNAFAGQLGLGCKSGLSYAEGFTITAVKNGEKVTAFFTKNERGIGVIRVLVAPRPTVEPNGVRIAIPVDRYDVGRFKSEAHDLFRFWEPGTVLVNGEAPAGMEWAEGSLHIDADTWLVNSDANLRSSYVIMGNVPYPVHDVRIGRVSHNFVARLNIGDVDFVLSREDVKDTAWTRETLADLHHYISQNFRRALTEAKESVQTRWEETVLRTVWMGSQTNLRGSHDYKIWTFDPNGYGRKASGHLSYQIRNLAQPTVTVITGFPAKNLSPAARERLVKFAGTGTFVILPSHIHTGMLDGRPNTFTWDRVLGETPAPKVAKAKREAKAETVYDIYGRSGMTAAQLAATEGTILYLNPNEKARHGDLDATVVMLYSSASLPRIQRFVPHISHYSDEVDRQRKAATAAITDYDRSIAQAKTLPTRFAEMDPNEVRDPQLAATIRLAKTDATASMERASKFGVAVDHKPLPNFIRRYPLVDVHSYGLDEKVARQERLFYVNAKYDANQAAALAASFSHGAVA